MKNRAANTSRTGFTLVEILVVLAIIGILAALLFPAFKGVRERAHQTNCASNLHQIYAATMLYYNDEKHYPATLSVLLAPTSDLNNTGSASTVDGSSCSASPTTCPNTKGTGYLKSSNKYPVCLDDDTQVLDSGNNALPHSSYGDVSTSIASGTTDTSESRYVWNYWGYKSDGTAYTDNSHETAYTANFTDSRYLLLPTTNVDPNKLPRLYNRYAGAAAPNTIITHCIYHRIPTGNNVVSPNTLYNSGTNPDPTGARDMILRLDGTVQSYDVSGFNSNGSWIKQTFQNNNS